MGVRTQVGGEDREDSRGMKVGWAGSVEGTEGLAAAGTGDRAPVRAVRSRASIQQVQENDGMSTRVPWSQRCEHGQRWPTSVSFSHGESEVHKEATTLDHTASDRCQRGAKGSGRCPVMPYACGHLGELLLSRRWWEMGGRGAAPHFEQEER